MPRMKRPSQNSAQQTLDETPERRPGNLFDSDAQTITVAVNCVGVMGKGIALEAKKRFPDVYARYVELCRRGEMKLGEPVLVTRPRLPWVLLFPTKGHWRARSRLEDIVAGLDFLRQRYKAWGITSLVVPAVGCGNGRLAWTEVGPVLHDQLSCLDIPVQVLEPLEIASPHKPSLG